MTEAPNFRQANKARTRAVVLQASRDLFQQVGYEAATIRAIAARANRSTGAFFANWPDKAAVYREIYGHPPLSPEDGAELLTALADVLMESANAVPRAVFSRNTRLLDRLCPDGWVGPAMKRQAEAA